MNRKASDNKKEFRKRAARFGALAALAVIVWSLLLVPSGLGNPSEGLIGGELRANAAGDDLAKAIPVPMDSYYQYVNDYDWQDLYTLMIGVCQTANRLDPDCVGKEPAFAIVRLSEEWDPFIFLGFHDKATNRTNMTLYVVDDGYVYELFKAREEEIFVDPERGLLLFGDGSAYYAYSPHVLLKTETGTDRIPDGFIPLPITDAAGLMLIRENLESFVIDYSGGGGAS